MIGRYRVAILGDSNIQADEPTGSVRGHLYPALKTTGHDIAAVGTKTDTRIADPVLRGHDGTNGLEIARARLALPALLSTARPHILILWLGTRELLPNTLTDADRATAPIRYAQMLADIRALSPSTAVLACTAPPCNLDYLPDAPAWIAAYNAALVGVAADGGATLVDVHARIKPETGLHDGVHLSDRGAQDASIALYQALTGLLGSWGQP